MRPTAILSTLLLAIFSGIGGAWLGNVRGHAQGVLETTAKQDADQVESLTASLAAISADITGSAEASRQLRNALTRIETNSQRSTKELKNALRKTSADRVGCRVDADSMRIIDAAADRAAARAASGIRHTLPAAGADN